MAVAIAEADDLVLDRRAVARARGARSGPSTSASGADWPGSPRASPSVVRVMPQLICGLSIRVGQGRERLRRLVAGLHLRATPSRSSGHRAAAACRSSGGRAANPGRSSVAERPTDGASPDPAGRDRLLADMDQAAQEGAGRQNHGTGSQERPPVRIDAGHPAILDERGPRPRPRRSSRLACSARIAPASQPRRACGRPGRAGRARPGPCGGSAPGTGCRRGRRPGPSGRPARRSPAPDGPCPARRSPGCRTSRQSSRADGSPAPCRALQAARQPPPLPAAGMAAADHDHVVMLLMGGHERFAGQNGPAGQRQSRAPTPPSTTAFRSTFRCRKSRERAKSQHIRRRRSGSRRAGSRRDQGEPADPQPARARPCPARRAASAR